jgi:hypothetical protein
VSQQGKYPENDSGYTAEKLGGDAGADLRLVQTILAGFAKSREKRVEIAPPSNRNAAPIVIVAIGNMRLGYILERPRSARTTVAPPTIPSASDPPITVLAVFTRSVTSIT